LVLVMLTMITREVPTILQVARDTIGELESKQDGWPSKERERARAEASRKSSRVSWVDVVLQWCLPDALLVFPAGSTSDSTSRHGLLSMNT